MIQKTQKESFLVMSYFSKYEYDTDFNYKTEVKNRS